MGRAAAALAAAALLSSCAADQLVWVDKPAGTLDGPGNFGAVLGLRSGDGSFGVSCHPDKGQIWLEDPWVDNPKGIESATLRSGRAVRRMPTRFDPDGTGMVTIILPAGDPLLAPLAAGGGELVIDYADGTRSTIKAAAPIRRTISACRNRSHAGS